MNNSSPEWLQKERKRLEDAITIWLTPKQMATRKLRMLGITNIILLFVISYFFTHDVLPDWTVIPSLLLVVFWYGYSVVAFSYNMAILDNTE